MHLGTTGLLSNVKATLSWLERTEYRSEHRPKYRPKYRPDNDGIQNQQIGGVPGLSLSPPVRRLLAAYLTAMAALALPTSLAAEPPFTSTADTVFDIIRVDDPSTFVCLSYQGRTTRQMWDKRVDNEFDFNVYLFQAHFSDSPPFDIIVNPEFGSVEAAETEARRYTQGLGQLPLVFRHGIRQFGIHKGMPTFSAGAGKIFVYADRTTLRISQDHLEESLMHESVHATLDRQYARSPEWQAAQASDNRFMTRYAESRPEGEDLAETALFAYGLIRYPGRIPPVDSRDILSAVPARIAVIKDILGQTPQVAPAPSPPANCY